MTCNATTNQRPNLCARCHRFIYTRAEWLELNHRRATFHLVGRLAEEEKAIGHFAFHVACVVDALQEAKEKAL